MSGLRGGFYPIVSQTDADPYCHHYDGLTLYPFFDADRAKPTWFGFFV
jgi:hypothetical protein